jgi:hypothetical protein
MWSATVVAIIGRSIGTLVRWLLRVLRTEQVDALRASGVGAY